MNAIVLFNHYDIVHLHNTNMINYLFIKANYVRTVHCNSISEHKYRWHKAIIAISHSVKDMLKQNGYDSVLINNGVNANLIVPKKNFSKSSVFSILQVGRVVFSEKGQDILLKAIANLVGRGINNIHLDYIGTGCDFQLLSEQIKAMNLSDLELYLYKEITETTRLVNMLLKMDIGVLIVLEIRKRILILLKKKYLI